MMIHRFFKICTSATVMLALMTPLHADEGMWLISLVEKVNGTTLAEKGFTVTPDDIFSLEHSSLKDAVVQFGNGCTGELVSGRGLLFTNHHCGYASIQELSTTEHNYLQDGYWAMQAKEELPVEGLTVSFLEDIADVTTKVEKATSGIQVSESRDSVITALQKQMADRAGCDGEFRKGVLKAFFGGNSYYFIVYNVFHDVRFVGAPPSSIGKFGKDTDNWMWPRHTGDFSVFRVYADRNNGPADYSEDNVPYTPKAFLPISVAGYRENDPMMVIGYPGTTNRFMTRTEMVDMRDVQNTLNIKMRALYQDVLSPEMNADPDIMIKYASLHFGSSNGWKKMMGMNACFDRLGVEQRCREEEECFTEWVNRGGKNRLARYGTALGTINECVAASYSQQWNITCINQSLARIGLMKLGNTTDRDALERLYAEYDRDVDKKVAKAMLTAARENLFPEYLPDFYGRYVDDMFTGDIDRFVDWLYDTSIFSTREKALASLDDTTDFSSDPAVVMYASISEASWKAYDAIPSEMKGRFTDAKKAFIAGIMEMHPEKAFYPDANFTMRLTYGSVLPYSPRDAVFYGYLTTLDGVMEKEDSTSEEFVVPERLKELWRAKDYGVYAMPDGRLPVAFITNCDITGGNSGSPTLNGRGELVGLAFDGNWEAMSSDVLFEPMLQRCISVDIRYVLFIIDKFGGASYLLDEMDIRK